MSDIIKTAPQFPFGALSVPFATDVRELSVLLAGTNAGQTPRQQLNFSYPVQVVGFYAEVITAGAVGGLVAPAREHILVQLDLDNDRFFSAQDVQQFVPGSWVSLSTMLLNGFILKLIEPGNQSPIFGVAFRWKLAPTFLGGAQIYEDALINFACYYNRK